MKKRHLTLTSAMATTLLALPACSSNDEWDDQTYASSDTAVCVDQSGNRVPDEQCDSGRSHVYGGYHSWYYFGRSAPIPYYGESVRDPRYAAHASNTPRAGTTYAKAPASSNMTRSAAVSRGGMGSSGHSYGGGRS